MRRSRIRSGIAAVLVAALFAITATQSVRAQGQVHVVQSGESLSVIAKKYGISLAKLIDLNQIADPDRLMPGDRLVVSETPTIHIVEKGESLWEIARKYGLNVEQLALWNGVSDPSRIYPGQEIVLAFESTIHTVKRGESVSQIAAAYGVTTAAIAQLNGLRDIHLLQIGQRLLIPPTGGGAVPAVAGSASRSAGRRFDRWPVSGTVSSRFGVRDGRMHEGIDIAAPHGTIVRAVAAGLVSYADWAGTYGLLVKIDHGGGVETRYGHNSQLLVQPGARVQAGDPIARVGSTGRSTGPHVHFEIRINDDAVDPLPRLP